MGSSGTGASNDDRWWQNPKLSPADLRQHSDTWSLADDAAMATLLQGISQRLVSRTHEVEGALERALEGTDRIITTIANTNNAFHMLANTQFIENRTYQDDADIVRDKKEVSEEPAVTEEDILARCRKAITDGLNLVASSYERHEIQDSDSDDDDSPGSPVPVYALIDPYEHKPLPLIIGSEGFLSDDKVGLEVSSSEENSKMTFSPEDTESEEELEDETDRVALQKKAIPASSSRAVDDESDSEWSEEDGFMPEKSSTVVGKQRPLQLSSDDGDDDDDDMFGPSSRNSEVGNIFSHKNSTSTTIPSTHVNSRRQGLDSDSEEDEGLFGKQQRSGGSFNGRRHPSISQGNSRNADSLPSSGVENVRAMPDPTPVTASDSLKSRTKASNLFGSDSDDEGDLFSSKPAAAGKASATIQHSQSEAKVSNSGGLFSSDDDSPLFSGPTPTQGPQNSKEKNEVPPPPSKEPAKKVPAGGVSIFGAAITSALRRQQSSDEESTDDVQDVDTTKNLTSPPSKTENLAPHDTADVKIPVKGGLFDSDEDENLFDTLVGKPVIANAVEKTHSSIVPPHLSSDNAKAKEDISHKDDESASNIGGKNSIDNSAGGLFSDEEDDLFGIPTTLNNKDVSLSRDESSSQKSATTYPETNKAKEEAVKPFRPPSLFTPPDNPTPSQPVSVSDPSKSNLSLFSSPSDDDDDIFSSISNPPYKASRASAFVTDPPPLPPQASSNDAHPSSKEQIQPGASNTADIERSINVGSEKTVKEFLPSALFSSTSDEDIFSSINSQKSSSQIPTPQRSKKTEFLQSAGGPKLDTKTTAAGGDLDTSHSEMEESKEVFASADNISEPISHSPDINSKQDEINDQKDNFSPEPSNLFAKTDAGIHTDDKKDDMYDSTDDLFSVTEKLNKPDGFSLNTDELHDPLKFDKQFEAKAGTSSMVSEDAVDLVSSRSLKDNSDKLIEGISPFGSSLQTTPNHTATQVPKDTTKPPFGGVALFGGKELAAQIDKRKMLLEPEKDKQKENSISDDAEDIISEGKTNVFDDDDIFGDNTGNSKLIINTTLHSQTPPLLPEEVEKRKFSENQDPERGQIPESKPINNEHSKSHDIDIDQQKLKPDKFEDKTKEEITTNQEIKPRKKPPIGGVSMFGSGGIGGSELFAKVLQRKSMLAPESDSSEDDTPIESAETPKSRLSSEENSTAHSKLAVPVSPVSPFTLPPVFAPDCHEPRPGEDENRASFDDPATHTNVLHSLNKTRARGSIKRRPPSRAHRKSGTDKSEANDSQDTSSTTETPSPVSALTDGLEHVHVIATDVNKTAPIQPEKRLLDASPGKVQTKEPVVMKENEVEDASMTVTSSKGSKHIGGSIEEPVSASHERKIVTSADKKDAMNSTKTALNVSKSSTKQSTSLFGGSDSDEDLFGEVKQKQDMKKSLASSGPSSVSKKSGKNSKSHSLFEDDDDDGIFSSKSQVKKETVSTSGNVPTAKLKGNLKQSSEPFEDPLLGNFTK